MSNEHAHESSVATYVIVALILGVITYIEFAIVEYEIAWLSNFWILFWLVLLSVAKFIMVIMFFMHLKDDDNLYSGFFASGMVFALGTFVVLSLLFTLPASFQYFQAQTAVAPEDHAAPAHGEEHGISEELHALIETDGYSRPTAQVLNTPRPKNLQVSLRGPALPEEPEFTLTDAPALFGQAAAQAEDAEEAEEAERAEAAEAEEPADEPADEPAPADAEEAAAQEDTAQEDTAQEDTVEEPAAIEWDEELGSQVYASNCASCHQGTGAGIPGVFPPLAEHMPVLYNADGGREFLVNTIIYGLQGEITVSGQTYNGSMPGWQQLSDEQIAAVLNHELTDWGNQDALEDFQPITADEVADLRGQDLSPQQVHEQREALSLP